MDLQEHRWIYPNQSLPIEMFALGEGPAATTYADGDGKECIIILRGTQQTIVSYFSDIAMSK